MASSTPADPLADPLAGALAGALLAAVRAQDFGATPDAHRDGAPLARFPSLDLAVAAFAPGRPPQWANVLFSREHPAGVAATIPADGGALQGVRFDADLTDPNGRSIAWDPQSDWAGLPWRALHGRSGLRFVAPYPASLLKLMVAVGVALAVERQRIAWPAALVPMIVSSDNDATTELVALLHRHRVVGALHEAFARCGLLTLQLQGTTAAGGWRNADGAGVGRIQMTAWDTLRLLWLLDPGAPPPPWLTPGTALLRPESRQHLHRVLQGQQLDHVLSSGSLRDVPGWVAGLPDAPAYAHKTGFTENYAADAGIVRTPRCHYIVALLSTLGQRVAPDPRCATTWRVPALGAAVHALIESLR